MYQKWYSLKTRKELYMLVHLHQRLPKPICTSVFVYYQFRKSMTIMHITNAVTTLMLREISRIFYSIYTKWPHLDAQILRHRRLLCECVGVLLESINQHHRQVLNEMKVKFGHIICITKHIHHSVTSRLDARKIITPRMRSTLCPSHNHTHTYTSSQP